MNGRTRPSVPSTERSHAVDNMCLRHIGYNLIRREVNTGHYAWQTERTFWDIYADTRTTGGRSGVGESATGNRAGSWGKKKVAVRKKVAKRGAWPASALGDATRWRRRVRAEKDEKGRDGTPRHPAPPPASSARSSSAIAGGRRAGG